MQSKLSKLTKSITSSSTLLTRSKGYGVLSNKAFFNYKSHFPRTKHTLYSTANTSSIKEFKFQSETDSLLDIVANSLYSEKQVFIRELISNACDAIEKLRFQTLTNNTELDISHKISIVINKEDSLFVITDNGIGMDEQDLHDNLGTIARSGSKKFIEDLKQTNNKTTSKDSIIGRFGVGFYSAFMVADKVEVYTRKHNTDDGFKWTSDGKGKYTIEKTADLNVGTKIVLHLKQNEKDYLNDETVKSIVEKHCSFVPFEISLNDKIVNSEPALWKLNENEISEEQHEKFYKSLSNSYDKPMYHLNYKTDAPINLRSIFYVPESNTEAFGLEKYEPGLRLYSRGVLIKSKAKELVPEWLRFVKGIVDSEDIPLNLSREMLQNGKLVNSLKTLITNRIIKWFESEKRDPVKFKDFIKKFGNFVKEGLCTINSEKNKKTLMDLLMFNTSKDKDEQVFLEQYVSRMAESQDKIYYIFAPNRLIAEQSPYYEPFKGKGVEVLFVFNALDEYLFNNIKKYTEYDFVNIESSEASKQLQSMNTKQPKQELEDSLGFKEGSELANWMMQVLPKNMVKQVKAAKLNNTQPALVTDHDSATFRMMQYFALSNAQEGVEIPQQPVSIEINLNNEIIKGLYKIHKIKEKEQLSTDIAHQIFDNARIAIGILNDSRTMLQRLNNLMHSLVHSNDNVVSAQIKKAE